MSLAAKEMSYRTVDVTPGVGQLSIFRRSGQRQVPVLIDGNKAIADSSAIIRYLEACKPEPKLIPNDPKQAAQAHLIEDWADKTLADAARASLLQAISNDPNLLVALLPEDLPEPFRQIMGNLPHELFNGVKKLLNAGQRSDLLYSLKMLSRLVEGSSWLIGNEMSIADIAVAAQLSLFKFPESSGSGLVGKGCPGFSDHPLLKPLFDWRDHLDHLLAQKKVEVV